MMIVLMLMCTDSVADCDQDSVDAVLDSVVDCDDDSVHVAHRLNC